jgi:hypothetical protein
MSMVQLWYNDQLGKTKEIKEIPAPVPVHSSQISLEVNWN